MYVPVKNYCFNVSNKNIFIFLFAQGCSSPLVVKFADTQKDKDQKKLQQIQSNIWNMAAGMNFSPQSYLATAALSQQFATNGVSIIFSLIFHGFGEIIVCIHTIIL